MADVGQHCVIVSLSVSYISYSSFFHVDYIPLDMILKRYFRRNRLYVNAKSVIDADINYTRASITRK